MEHWEEFTWKGHSRINFEISFSTWKFYQIPINVSKVLKILPSLDLSFQVKKCIAKLKATIPTL